MNKTENRFVHRRGRKASVKGYANLRCVLVFWWYDTAKQKNQRGHRGEKKEQWGCYNRDDWMMYGRVSGRCVGYAFVEKGDRSPCCTGRPLQQSSASPLPLWLDVLVSCSMDWWLTEKSDTTRANANRILIAFARDRVTS